MPEKVKDILKLIEELAPKQYAMKWDNVGLQIGSMNQEVQKVMVCLDLTEKVMMEAIENETNLIITHHPVIFSPLKRITREEIKGRFVYKAIENNISVYTAHTNMDVAPGGLNDVIAEKLGLESLKIIDVTEKERYYKFVVFIPEGYENTVADVLASTGAGFIGNYSHCTFRTTGEGTFKALEGTSPFIGEQGKLEKVREIRLETIVPESILENALEKMIKAHPYEEVAYDIYPLHNEGTSSGIGRVGKLSQPMTVMDLIQKIKRVLAIDYVRAIGKVDDVVETLCVVNGSGGDFIQKANQLGCQCLMTGDVKYHDAQLALELGINVIDAGHFETEMIFVEFMVQYLKEKFVQKNMDVKVVPSKTCENPFQIV